LPDKKRGYQAQPVQNSSVILAAAAILGASHPPNQFMDNFIRPSVILNPIETPVHTHPHGFWRGGTIYQRFSDKVNMSQDLFSLSEIFTSAGTPVSKQLHTNTAGHNLYITSIKATAQGVVDPETLQLRDATADSGTLRYVGNKELTPEYTKFSEFDNMVPKLFENGIRFDAADQTASQRYVWDIVGWEERKDIFQ